MIWLWYLVECDCGYLNVLIGFIVVFNVVGKGYLLICVL